MTGTSRLRSSAIATGEVSLAVRSSQFATRSAGLGAPPQIKASREPVMSAPERSGPLTPPLDEDNRRAIDDLARLKISGAAPGPYVIARRERFTARLAAYASWYLGVAGAAPGPAHLSAASVAMIEFRPPDGRSPASMNPWVLDSDFPDILRLTQAQVLPFQEASDGQL